MKKFLSIIVLACIAWSAYGADTGEVVELFACHLKEGKTMADFDAAAAAWKKDVENVAAAKNYFAAVMVPFRAKAEYDLVWIGSNPNLNDWAASAGWTRTAAGQVSQDRFDKVAICDSGLHFSTTLYEAIAEGKPGDPPAALEGYGCTLNKGKTMADVTAAEKTWIAAVNALKAKTPDLAKFSTYRYAPLLADTGYDLIYLSVNHDLAAYAATESAWAASAEGSKADAAIAEAETCKSGLWLGHIVRQPAPAQPAHQ